MDAYTLFEETRLKGCRIYSKTCVVLLDALDKVDCLEQAAIVGAVLREMTKSQHATRLSWEQVVYIVHRIKWWSSQKVLALITLFPPLIMQILRQSKKFLCPSSFEKVMVLDSKIILTNYNVNEFWSFYATHRSNFYQYLVCVSDSHGYSCLMIFLGTNVYNFICLCDLQMCHML